MALLRAAVLLASTGAAHAAVAIATTTMTLSKAPNTWGAPTTSVYSGINLGHRNDNDTTWIAFMESSGVNAVRMFGGAGMGNLALKSSTLGGLVQTANAFGGCIQHPSQPIGMNACVLSAPNPKSAKCNYGLPGNNATFPGSSDCAPAAGCVATCNPMTLLGSSSSWTPDSFGGAKTYYGSNSAPYFGKDLNNTYLVSSLSTYTTATATLRTWAGHNPFPSTSSGPGFWAYPPPHDLIDFNNRQSAGGQYNPEISGAPATVINTTYASLGFRPLVVAHLGCGSFEFSTLNPANGTYWTEHWELYKFSYAAAMWMWKYNITKAEVHNEPDLSSNNACMDPTDPDNIAAAAAYSAVVGYPVSPSIYSTLYWADFFSVRSVAHQDAYADANADVAANRRACPFPGACPITLNIYGSAMAQGIGNPLLSATSNQLGGATVQNAYFRFPCTAGSTCTQTGLWNTRNASLAGAYPWGVDNTFTSFQIYSYHSYGNTGDNLFNKASNYIFSSLATPTPLGTISSFYAPNVFKWRGVATAAAPLTAASPLTAMPISVTEFASLTGADFGLEGSSSDSYYHATRLGTQLINFALLGQETFYFKFSMMPLGSTVTQARTMVNKHGIHFAENNRVINNGVASFQVGDQTTSGAVFSLITPYVTGGKPLLSCGLADSAAGWSWPTGDLTKVYGMACAVILDGNTARIFLVNDCNGTPARNAAGMTAGVALQCADRQINIPVASLSPDASSVVSITQVSAPANTCVNQTSTKDKLTGGTRSCLDPVLGGRSSPFTTSTSASGYFGEVSAVVPVSSIPAGGLPYLLPVFGFARIDIPLAPQKMTATPTSIDTSLFAGVNINTNFGNAPLLSVGTSSTAVHDSTTVILLQFATPTFTAANLAILELTLANGLGNPLIPNGTAILQVIGINPKRPVVWNETAMTWAGSQWLLNTPTGLVNSVGTNYVLLGPQNSSNPLAGIYNFVIGHISVSTSDPVGMVKKVDISRFVNRAQAANACSISIAIVRRIRSNVQSPASPAGDTIPADSLATGSVAFFSSEAPGSQGPILRTYSDAIAPAVACNQQTQQNFTVSSLMTISNVNAATFNGIVSNGRHLSQAVPPAVVSSALSISNALGVPSNAVTVSPTGSFTTNIALSLSANSPPDPSVIQAAIAQAAAGYNSVVSGSTGAAAATSQVVQYRKMDNGTNVVIPNNQTIVSSDGIATEVHGFSVSSDADPTLASKPWNRRRLLFSQDLPASRTGRRLLQQSYAVQVSFTSLADAQAFANSLAPGTSTVSSLVAFVNANSSGNPNLNVAAIFTPSNPTVDASATVDIYAPYHSPASHDVVYNMLASGQININSNFDNSFHGDPSDLQINPASININPGWQPTGANAPAGAPELVIVVVPAPAPSPVSNMYTRANFIGLGVGLGVGEAVFFGVLALAAYMMYVKPMQSALAAAIAAGNPAAASVPAAKEV